MTESTVARGCGSELRSSSSEMHKMAAEIFLGSGGMLHRALLFMLKLGWRSRFRLPVLIVVAFVAMDIRMQLEIDVEI